MNRVDIRLEAVKIAIKIHAMDTCNVVETAKIVENYIVGDANIPEYVDPNIMIKQMVDSMERMTNPKNIAESLSLKYGFGLCTNKDTGENGN